MRKISIPFKIKNVYEGLAETEGVITIENEHLKIEFQTKDSIFGFLRSQLNTILLPIKELAHVNHKPGLFKDTLTLRATNMRYFLPVPTSKHGEIQVIIDKKNREDALAFVSDLQLVIAEIRVKEVDDL